MLPPAARIADRPAVLTVAVSIDSEGNFNIYFNRHRLALQRCGLEPILLHGRKGLLIQSHPEVTDYLNTLRVPLRIHDERNDANTLKFCPPGFVGEFRVRSKK
jgi:hypothetical protein